MLRRQQQHCELQVLSGTGDSFLASPSTKTWGDCWFPAAGREDYLIYGILPHLGLFPHQRLEFLSTQHTTYLPSKPQRRPQAVAGAAGRVVLCLWMQC